MRTMLEIPSLCGDALSNRSLTHHRAAQMTPTELLLVRYNTVLQELSLLDAACPLYTALIGWHSTAFSALFLVADAGFVGVL